MVRARTSGSVVVKFARGSIKTCATVIPSVAFALRPLHGKTYADRNVNREILGCKLAVLPAVRVVCGAVQHVTGVEFVRVRPLSPRLAPR